MLPAISYTIETHQNSINCIWSNIWNYQKVSKPYNILLYLLSSIWYEIETTQKDLQTTILVTNSNTILHTAIDKYIWRIERRYAIFPSIISVWK